MNERQVVLIEAVMDMISGTLDNMKADEFHAPASWLLENWWCSLNAALQIGNQGDSSACSLETADHSESEKGDKDIPLDQ